MRLIVGRSNLNRFHPERRASTDAYRRSGSCSLYRSGVRASECSMLGC